MLDTLAPGGWLQVQEMEVKQYPSQCTSWNNIMAIMGAMFDKIGIGADYASKLSTSFEKAGLRNVTAEKIKLPAGMKMGNEADAMNSLIPFKITIPTLKQAIQGKLSKRRTEYTRPGSANGENDLGLGIELEPSVTDQLEERFEEEMMAEGAVFTSYIICGQKAD